MKILMDPVLKRIVQTEITGLSNITFSEEMSGDYWCQSVVTKSSGMYVLTESDALTITRPENYAGLVECTNIQSHYIAKCAEYTTNIPAPSLNQSSECDMMTEGQNNCSVTSIVSTDELGSTQKRATSSAIGQGLGRYGFLILLL